MTMYGPLLIRLYIYIYIYRERERERESEGEIMSESVGSYCQLVVAVMTVS